MKRILIGIASALITSCNTSSDRHCKYIVWTGTAVFATGVCTEKIDTIGNSLSYLNSNGVKTTIDKSKVFKIEQYK